MISGASKKMITERLRQLEAQGLVHRAVLETSPVSVEYSITEFGRTALGVLDQLRLWSEGLPEDFAG
jgi:DNA-binding HxlR family transcriptional regulator